LGVRALGGIGGATFRRGTGMYAGAGDGDGTSTLTTAARPRGQRREWGPVRAYIIVGHKAVRVHNIRIAEPRSARAGVGVGVLCRAGKSTFAMSASTTFRNAEFDGARVIIRGRAMRELGRDTRQRGRARATEPAWIVPPFKPIPQVGGA
jgi:hypothetical protein